MPQRHFLNTFLGSWPKTPPTAQWRDISLLGKAFFGLGWDGQAF